MCLPVYKIFLGKKELYTKRGLQVHRCFQGTVRVRSQVSEEAKHAPSPTWQQMQNERVLQATRRAHNVMEMHAYLLLAGHRLKVKWIVQFYSKRSYHSQKTATKMRHPISFRENRNP